MPEPAEPRRPVANPGVVSRSLTAVAQGLKWLLLSLLFSILLEWAGMLWWWQELGVLHSQHMVTTELNYLDADFRRSLVTSDPLPFAKSAATRTVHLLFEQTGFMALREWVTPTPHNEESGVRPWLHHAYVPVSHFIQAAIQITQVFAIRLSILGLATPTFGLFALVGLVDGLVRRDLRRWGGGRESSFIYHYAKTAMLPLIIATWVLYLAVPVSLHPSWVILPFSILLGFTVAITASTFKKYL